MEINQIGNIANDSRSWNNPQSGRVYGSDGISPTLTTYQGGNLEPKVIVEDTSVLTQKRTEYGKQIRKAYEIGEIKESRHNMTELEPRKDGISNTLTTVQKDNLLLEKVKIKQATKDGYIECNIGGGSGLVIS